MSPVSDVIQHTDNCPRCSQCDFCPTGKALIEAATKRLGEMFAPPNRDVDTDIDEPILPPIPRLN